MTPHLVSTPSNMVTSVRNAIESYQMGPLRALAQEPVQNALDEKSAPQVRVEYQLHVRSAPDGTPYYLLTITDSGTGGLKGPVLTPEQLDERGYKLNDGENWAAFEGQGFTEKSGGDLGNRGQGKSAFLYHSDPTAILNDGRERNLILYDTLLADGEYRFGMRYAQPIDKIMSPPFYGDDARLTIMDEHTVETGLAVSLNLEPLTDTGARIIIPFATKGAIDAIHNRELHRWLQRCWWRAIQTKRLEIAVIDEHGDTELIRPPTWWESEPWTTPDANTHEFNDLPVGDGLTIKRIVVHYDPDLQADEIPHHPAQYAGVQLLRGQQWIQTINFRDYDSIPAENRAGLRAFVEFDKRLEEALKDSEKPQHESFDGRFSYVAQVRQQVQQAINDFAALQGWGKPAKTDQLSQQDQEHAADFLTTFVNPPKTKTSQSNVQTELDTPPAYQWHCSISGDFPDPASNRVDWGQSIGNIAATITVEPTPANRWARLSLEITAPGSQAPEIIQTKDVELSDVSNIEQFGSFQIVKGLPHQGQLSCAEPGVYILKVHLTHAGQRVQSASKRIYVQTDPPTPPDKQPYAVSIKVENISNPSGKRINSGDQILIHITAKNRTANAATLELTASLEDLLLCDKKVLNAPGTPAGDTPQVVTGVHQPLFLYIQIPSITAGQSMQLNPGKYVVRADLNVQGEQEPVANATHTILFEVSPAGQVPELPFELQAIEDEGSHPMWDLIHSPPDQWTLQYHARNPIYRELPEQPKTASKVAGRLSFITEVCACGLLEWALQPLQTSDSSKIDLLQENATNGAGDPVRDQYLEKLERLELDYHQKRLDQPVEYDRLKRQTVADMLHIFQGSN